MLRPRWRKVLRDLWSNKTRTMLVVLSIAIGVFAVGVITNSRIVLSQNLLEGYAATKPAHATILTLEPFDDALVEAIRNIDSVGEAEARRNVTVRVKIGPDEWINLQLLALSDYEDIQVAKVMPNEGAWPPPEREMLIERSSLGLINAAIGDVVTIKLPSGKERQVRIAGTTHDILAALYVMSNIGYGHISLDTLQWFEEPRNFNELYIRVAENGDDRDQVIEVVNLVQDKIEESGRAILFTFIPEPNQPPLDYVIQAILAVLGAIGLLALVLSGFLVVNTISALLTQQTQQIGILKTIGASTRQIIPLYLVTVLIFGLLALLIAMPLGAISAYYMVYVTANFLNFNITHFEIPPLAFALQAGVAILVPFMAGLVPVLSGTRVTVQEAINSQGMGRGRFGSSVIDRLLVGKLGRTLLRWFSRPTLISLRNTFRRKRRLILTLITLILGGSIFIAVFSVQASLASTLDTWIDYYQYDVAVQLSRPYRIDRIKQVLLELPDVVDVEGFGFYTARRLRPDGSNSNNITLFAPKADTRVIKPSLVAGRWLDPEDKNAIVVNTLMLRSEPDIQLGDDIVLKIEGKEITWQIVGIAQGGGLTPTAFINNETLARLRGLVGRAEWFMTVTTDHTPAGQNEMTKIMEDYLTSQGVRVNLVFTSSQDRATVEGIFQIMFALLLMMGVVLAVVGGLGLMGTMSINVLERTREIGVMRAVGASNGSILKIILFEGIFIGAISWIIGALIAFPISKFMSDTIGRELLSTALSYTFSVGGTVIWLIAVIFLASVASFLPAWGAARLTVREILAYE